MSKGARSWACPLGIFVGIATVLLSVGWMTASADFNPSNGWTHERIVPASGDQARRSDDHAVLELGDERYFWNRSVRLFVPHEWVKHRFGRRPPAGTVFVDPFTGRRFDDLLRYRRHLEDQGQPPVVDIVQLERRRHRG
jgi:hypothetical protein